MNRTSLPSRAISVVLSTTLAFTMMPAAAFAAIADDAQSTSTTEAAEGAVDETATTETDTTAAEGAEGAPAATDIISESHSVQEPSATEGEAAPAATEAPQIMRAAVNVASTDEAVKVLTYNGMTFQITPEGTATLVGVDATAEGALDIPSQVVAGANTYIVSGVEKLRGGVHR